MSGEDRPRGILTALQILAVISLAGVVAWALLSRRKRVEDRPVPAPEDERERIARLPLKYDLVRTVDSGMKDRLRGIALDAGGRLYAAGDGIRVFDSGGRPAADWRTSAPATCVAVAENGEVYVGLAAKIVVYSADGKLVREFGKEGKEPGELRTVTSVAVSGSDAYVADAGNRVVHQFSAAGEFVRGIGLRDVATGAPGFIVPSPHFDVAAGRDGAIFATDPGRHRIERYGKDWKLLSSWGRFASGFEGFCGCCNPTDFAFLRDGRVVTSEKGVPRIKVHDPSGNVLAYIEPSHFPENAAGIDLAADGEDRIHAADPVTGKILVFAPAAAKRQL